MRFNKNSGFTLIELLLGMVMGLIVLSGVLYIYIAVITSSSATLKASKLNSQLMQVMSIITNDIRRAGYWANTSELASENPFSQLNDSALTVVDSISSNTKILENSTADGKCILYAYDANENGVADNDSEYFGFRLNNRAIQMRIAGSVTEGDSCTNGTWAALTDTDLYIVSGLAFNRQNSTCVNTTEPDGIDNDNLDGIDDPGERDCYSVTPDPLAITIETRQIEVTISAYLVNDPEVNHTVSSSVRIRNDMVRVR